jgi:4a-hydroxytetrahydrobiopterin dehydratase
MQILSDDQIEAALQSLNVAWAAIPGQGLVRVFKTPNFMAGVELVGRIAAIAEQYQHHPDIKLTYGEVEVTLTTHNVSGVTEKDIELASAIDELAL